MKVGNIEVQYIDHMGTDNSVANAARVSFDKLAENYTKDQNDKLIKYLAKHKHFSPFNHTFITVKVKAPIFVARQLVKHEYMPINEISRRYVDDEPSFYLPSVWRERAENKKQGSLETPITKYVFHEFGKKGVPTEFQHGVDSTADEVVQDFCKYALEVYDALLYAGVCPEQARMVLPLNMQTEWYWSGTLKAFSKMLGLRLDPHTQKESRDVAEKILEITKTLFPVSTAALLNLE